MGKKSAPDAPDPVATIEAQKDANRITQYTPNGNIQYGTVGADGNFVANTGGDAQMQTESDFNRKLREGAQSLGVNFAGQVSPQLGGYNRPDEFRQALNEHGASATALRSGLTNFNDPNGLTNGLNPLNTDFSSLSKQAQDATFQSSLGLLQPQFDLQQRRTQQQLADQGLPMGSEAYNGELNRLDTNQGQQLNQLALQSVLAGNNRQNELFGQNLQARQEGYNENSGMYDRAAGQRAQQFGENQGVANFDLSKQGWLANLEQQQRSGQYNEVAALLGLQQVPSFQAVPQVDAAGIINTSAALNNQNYQTGMAGLGSLAGTAGTLAGVAIKSDIRLKEKIVWVGKKNKHNIYEFDYIDHDGRYRGVMAHEVEHVPGAVITGEDGYKRVNYGVIGVNFKRVA